MRQLIVSAQMTLDAVIDRVDEWFSPAGEPEAYSHDQLMSADAMLLGRKTYQGLANVWPGMTDPRGFADRVNSMPKFVVSNTLEEPLEWNATLLKGDLAESVSRLKREPGGGNLLMYGIGPLALELARLGLVDEIRLFVHPVVLGDGARPFHSQGTLNLRTVSTTSYRNGVTLCCYQPLLDA